MDKENIDNNSPDLVPSSQGSHLELVRSSQGSPLVSCTQHLDLRLEDATEDTTLDSQYTPENLTENVTEDLQRPELGNSPSESVSLVERRAEKRAAETELTGLDGPKKQIKIEEDEEVILTIDNSDVEILETESRPKKSIEIVTINDSLNESQNNISSNTFEEKNEQPEDNDNENKSEIKDLDFNKSNISKSRDDTFEDENESHIISTIVETPKTSNDTLEFEQPKSADASMSSLKLSQSQNSSVS